MMMIGLNNVEVVETPRHSMAIAIIIAIVILLVLLLLFGG